MNGSFCFATIALTAAPLQLDAQDIERLFYYMSYSQHTRRTPPGPQASVPWQEEVIEYFLEHVPANKLSLGIPTGSQHWYTSQETGSRPSWHDPLARTSRGNAR